MHQYQERDGEENRTPGGKTRVKDIWKGLKEEDALDRTKWENDIQYHSGDPRRREKPEEKKKIDAYNGTGALCTGMGIPHNK